MMETLGLKVMETRLELGLEMVRAMGRCLELVTDLGTAKLGLAAVFLYILWGCIFRLLELGWQQ